MIPKDYKRTYVTEDLVNVDPGDEVWVAKMDLETEAWTPTAMTAKAAEDSNHRHYWSSYDQCLEHCEALNETEV